MTMPRRLPTTFVLFDLKIDDGLHGIFIARGHDEEELSQSGDGEVYRWGE
jgi:hypothetical protein